MDKERDVFIIDEKIELKVIIPAKYDLLFADLFMEMKNFGHSVDSIGNYPDRADTSRVKLKIFKDKENDFYEFLKKFCDKRKLSFRDPRRKRDIIVEDVSSGDNPFSMKNLKRS